MKNPHRSFATRLAAPILYGLVFLSLAEPASAQPAPTFPSQTVRIVVPTGAGTTADIMARLLSDKLPAHWRQSVIVENRPGIAGITNVAKSPADGHTLMLTANGYAATGALNRELTFDPVADVVGAAQIGTVPMVLIVPLDLPARTLGEVIALAKSKPGMLNVASAGLGSTSHLASEVFRRTAEVDVKHVPYRGPESITSIIRGDTQLNFVPVTSALDLINTNKLRAIAVISPQRIATLPNVPTFAESGLPAFVYNAWFGLFAPAGTPRPVLREVGQATARVLDLPDIKATLAQQGVDIAFAESEAFDRTVKSDAERFTRMLAR